MILHRLLLEDFRGVVREEVNVPLKGVLVVEGPNESGKTSLMDALEMLLEHKASSGRADVKATRPVGRDVPVVVEAEFTIDDQKMLYRKEFVKGKQTSLAFPGSARPALSGDDAHDFVRDLLDRKVDRSLWRALRIAQDEPIGQVDAAKGMDSLRRALDAAAGGEDPTGDDSLIARVLEERNRFLTAKKGEPTGELARSDERLTVAREALAEADRSHAQLGAAVENHENQAAVHRAHKESLTLMEAEAARLEAAGMLVADLRKSSYDADATVDRAAARHDLSSRGVVERLMLVAGVAEEEDRAAKLRAAVEQSAERLGPADARAEEARSALESAEVGLSEARSLHDQARAVRENELRRTQIDQLDKTLDKLKEVGSELVAAENKLGELKVSDDAIEQIRLADDALREAVIRSSASAPTVEVSGSGEVRVSGETRDAAPGWSQRIVEDTAFEVGTVSLTVIPAGDTDSVRREEVQARTRLDSVLEAVGVATRAEAEERARATAALRAEVESLRRRRSDLLGVDTLEDLNARRDALHEQIVDSGTADKSDDEADPVVESSENPDEADGAALRDPAAAVAEAVDGVAACRAEERTAATEAQAIGVEHATNKALAEEAETRLDERTQVLARYRSVASDEHLEETERQDGVRLDEARESATKARTELEAALVDAPPELLENARASLIGLRAEEQESANAVAVALAEVNVIGGQGRLADVSAAEREVEEAELENTALWRRARAADLLYQTLTKRRTEALLAYQEPFHRAVVELGTLVYGRDFDVQLGEDLTILSRRIGDVAVDYGSLSGGAREQLAVIVRIACAQLVGSDGVPVFLDDTMGYTDPVRRLKMGAVIAAAGTTSQVVVLTCDRARFAGIGGAHTHVMRRGAAQAD